ncbi:efflux RND transporter periplasmic adaptor subunit [Streptacidiphilus sp. N1-3]|uniref:Efflux RND transporter periplasmic adaptor subunit n=1 Tax=Streptacidiphilus alkalitolerans TaxID=3342712 RepID=A0ABV6X8I1_9ACTN
MKALPRRRRAVLIYSVAGLVLVGGAGVTYAAVNDSGSTGATAAKTATVAQGTVRATVSGSGSLVSPSNAGLDFVTGGTLSEVDVAVGAKVTAGEVLAKVDPTDADAALTTAQATLATAQENLASVEAGNGPTSSSGSGGSSGSGSSSGGGSSGGSGSGSAGGGGTGGTAPTTGASGGRSTQPSTGGSPSSTPTTGTPTPTGTATPSASATTSAAARPASYVADTTTTTASATPSVNPADLAQAEQQVTTAENGVADAQRAVDGTVLTAPESGTVASVAGKVGDSVSGSSASATSSSSTPSGFVVITNPTGMELSADFSEADALKLRSGQSASVTLTAEAGTAPLTAKVLSISSLPVSSSSSSSGGGGGGGGGGGSSSSTAVQYAVLLAITSDTSTLQTGLSASVQVTTAEATDALWVPTSAVTGTGAGSSVTVVGANGATTRQPVTVGVQGDTQVQITKGVSLGQKVQLTVVSAGGSNGFPSDAFPGGS